MNANDVLRIAMDLISGDRFTLHGPAERSFAVIADLWQSYLRGRKGGNLGIKDVATMMALFKIARTLTGLDKDDDYIDGAAYLALAAQMKDKERNEQPSNTS